jgi:[acyl-carrier-protein] S-malonyltransferase
VTHSFVRTPTARLGQVLGELDELGEWHEVSCQVDEDLHMVSLREGRLDWLQQRLRAIGGMPLYTMRPPMHCTVFGPLRDLVEAEVFSRLTFADPTIPVIADQDGTMLRTGDGVRAMLLDGFVRTVRWPSVVATLVAKGVGTVFVAGPDRLFGRVRLTKQTFNVVPVNPALATKPRQWRLAA